jgi:hypothetical protein
MLSSREVFDFVKSGSVCLKRSRNVVHETSRTAGRLSGKTGKSAGQAVRGGFYKRQIHILDFCVFPRFRR